MKPASMLTAALWLCTTAFAADWANPKTRNNIISSINPPVDGGGVLDWNASIIDAAPLVSSVFRSERKGG